MTIAEALKNIHQIQIRVGSAEVCETAARELACRTGAPILRLKRLDPAPRTGVFQITDGPARIGRRGRRAGDRIQMRLRKDGSGFVASSSPRFLYGALASLLDVASERDL